MKRCALRTLAAALTLLLAGLLHSEVVSLRRQQPIIG